MRVLVLGSAGQIGHRLCKVLRDNGHNVVEFDIVNDPLEDLRLYGGPLCREMSEVDFVMFLAFDVGGSTYLKEYEKTQEFMDNNVDIMRNTFEILRETKVPFIFASSQMSNMSWSTYGLLKAIGERYTSMNNGKVVKFWNVYDLETDPEKFHVITDFILSARNEGIIQCRTDGTESRQFLHGEDASLALMKIMESFGEIPEDELHITSFEWNTIIDVINTINDIYPCDVTLAPWSDTVQHDAKNEPDKTILKYWKPRISLVEGIRRVAREMDSE